jgi:hypothetical protein
MMLNEMGNRIKGSVNMSLSNILGIITNSRQKLSKLYGAAKNDRINNSDGKTMKMQHEINASTYRFELNRKLQNC